jgi:hypothetical protein
MNKKLLEKLNAVGFEHKFSHNSLTSMDKNSHFFTTNIKENDLDHVKKIVGKNHFSPYGYRSLFIGTCLWSEGGMGFYATSDIRGIYRRYRAWYEDTSYDLANIFASGKTLEDCVNNFIDNYNGLTYNESR